MSCCVLFLILRIGAAGVLLLPISVRDIRTGRLPERLIRLLAAASSLRVIPLLPGMPGGTAETLFAVLFDMLSGGAGTLLLLLAVTRLADRLTGRNTLGGGDVRLAAALGLHLGFFPMLIELLAASFLALPEALLRRRRGESGFPFAPYLSAAGMAMMILLAGV